MQGLVFSSAADGAAWYLKIMTRTKREFTSQAELQAFVVAMFRIINHRTVRGEELPYGIRNEGGLVCFFTVPTLYYGQEARYKEECAEMRKHAETMCAALNQQITG